MDGRIDSSSHALQLVDVVVDHAVDAAAAAYGRACADIEVWDQREEVAPMQFFHIVHKRQQSQHILIPEGMAGFHRKELAVSLHALVDVYRAEEKPTVSVRIRRSPSLNDGSTNIDGQIAGASGSFTWSGTPCDTLRSMSLTLQEWQVDPSAKVLNLFLCLENWKQSTTT